MPKFQSRFPPNRFGMSSISIYLNRVGRTSAAGSIEIFDVVAASNHFVMKPQTMGKKDGAPMTKIRSTDSG